MNESATSDVTGARLRSAIVVRVSEDVCQIVIDGHLHSVRYATVFPSPRVERILPGHLVAVATGPDGSDVVVWRWYDAVVLVVQANAITLWEPSHGEVVARPRHTDHRLRVGTRAYVSAGLPGADWWVAGPATANSEKASVELDEVERLYTEHDLWDNLI